MAGSAQAVRSLLPAVFVSDLASAFPLKPNLIPRFYVPTPSCLSTRRACRTSRPFWHSVGEPSCLLPCMFSSGAITHLLPWPLPRSSCCDNLPSVLSWCRVLPMNPILSQTPWALCLPHLLGSPPSTSGTLAYHLLLLSVPRAPAVARPHQHLPALSWAEYSDQFSFSDSFQEDTESRPASLSGPAPVEQISP